MGRKYPARTPFSGGAARSELAWNGAKKSNGELDTASGPGWAICAAARCKRRCKIRKENHNMGHPRLILHVGSAKCGSSALQTALSAQTRLTAPNTPGLVYAALHARRGLLHGPDLVAVAQSQSFGYESSSFAQDLRDMDCFYRDKTLANNDHVILSNEGWFSNFNMMAKSGFLDALGVSFGVFAVVRPQIEFVNSGWWQWGAWDKFPSLETWSARQATLWHSHLRKWQRHPACTGITVRLMSRDIVGDFFDAYGLTPEPELPRGQTSNVSLPGEVLRLFQRHPDLRQGRPVIDFVLSKFVLGTQPTPWVVNPDLAEKLVTQARDDNEALCALLPGDQAARMRNTQGWWSADAYADKPLESSVPQPADTDAAAQMNGRLIAALSTVRNRLLFGEVISDDLLTPLPAGTDVIQLDTRNALLTEALFKAATAGRSSRIGVKSMAVTFSSPRTAAKFVAMQRYCSQLKMAILTKRITRMLKCLNWL